MVQTSSKKPKVEEITLKDCQEKFQSLFSLITARTLSGTSGKNHVFCGCYQKNQFCKHLPDCDYAHAMRDLRPRLYRALYFKIRPCIKLAQGCSYGNKCLFIHDDVVFPLGNGIRVYMSKQDELYRVTMKIQCGALLGFSIGMIDEPERDSMYSEFLPYFEALPKVCEPKDPTIFYNETIAGPVARGSRMGMNKPHHRRNRRGGPPRNHKNNWAPPKPQNAQVLYNHLGQAFICNNAQAISPTVNQFMNTQQYAQMPWLYAAHGMPCSQDQTAYPNHDMLAQQSTVLAQQQMAHAQQLQQMMATPNYNANSFVPQAPDGLMYQNAPMDLSMFPNSDVNAQMTTNIHGSPCTNTYANYPPSAPATQCAMTNTNDTMNTPNFALPSNPMHLASAQAPPNVNASTDSNTVMQPFFHMPSDTMDTSNFTMPSNQIHVPSPQAPPNVNASPESSTVQQPFLHMSEDLPDNRIETASPDPRNVASPIPMQRDEMQMMQTSGHVLNNPMQYTMPPSVNYNISHFDAKNYQNSACSSLPPGFQRQNSPCTSLPPGFQRQTPEKKTNGRRYARDSEKSRKNLQTEADMDLCDLGLTFAFDMQK